MKRSLLADTVRILVSACIVGLIFNAFAPKGLPLIRTQAEKVQASDSSLFTSSSPARRPVADSIRVEAPLHERALKNQDSTAKAVEAKKEKQVFTIISLEQFKRLLQEHRGIVMDARNEEDYVKGHIKTARSIPAMEFEKHFGEIAEIPRDTLIIIYCNNPECHLGRMLADNMGVMHFSRMVLYDDGWDGWVKAKMPIDSTSESQ